MSIINREQTTNGKRLKQEEAVIRREEIYAPYCIVYHPQKIISWKYNNSARRWVVHTNISQAAKGVIKTLE